MILFEILYYALVVLVFIWLGTGVYHLWQAIRFARVKSRDIEIPKYKGRNRK